MHIGLVGGIDRNRTLYGQLARECGHSVECHTGVLAGRGSDSLAALVERADLVVVVTDVNSHAGVLGARRLSRARGRRCVLVRRMGTSRFRTLLGELETDAETHCPGAHAA
jgi:hypothetical protein